ncbi:hypothetical protein LINPERHAP1_LOCUS10076 [Linum perenne]
MGWNYPDISLEELVKLIKGFVDILILATGYQSTGVVAQWNSDNVKKAFQWGSFFQNVLTDMSCTDTYQGCVKELEEALCHMKSDPSFPQGLASISYDSLLHAKEFVLTHLFYCLPLRNSHLQALLRAMVEMDLEKLPGVEHDRLNAYLSKLQLHSVPVTSDAQGFPVNNTTRTDIRKCCGDDLTKLAIEACLKRTSTVSCISKVEEVIGILSKATSWSSHTESNSMLPEKQKHERVPMSDRNMELLVDYDKCNRWRAKNVSYFLSKKTVRMVAGANIMFSAPKNQWEQVLKRLDVSTQCTDDSKSETIELLLLGCISDKWSSLVEFLMSFSYDKVTILKMYQDVCNLLPRTSEATHFKVKAATAKVTFIQTVSKRNRDSTEGKFVNNEVCHRCCNCVQDMKEHEECKHTTVSFIVSYFRNQLLIK